VGEKEGTVARNVIGLRCSLVTGGLLAWTLPMGYLAFCQYALPEAWTALWTWPARLHGLRGRAAPVHHPRPPYPPQPRQLGEYTDIYSGRRRRQYHPNTDLATRPGRHRISQRRT
jgi:hypothetical protein